MEKDKKIPLIVSLSLVVLAIQCIWVGLKLVCFASLSWWIVFIPLITYIAFLLFALVCMFIHLGRYS